MTVEPGRSGAFGVIVIILVEKADVRTCVVEVIRGFFWLSEKKRFSSACELNSETFN